MARQQPDGPDLLEEISNPEPSTGKAWLIGIGLALLLIGYGALCHYTGHGWQPGGRARHSEYREVFGREASALGWVFITAGLFVHFNWYWTYHKWLQMLAPIARVLAILAFIVSLGWFAMLRVRIG